MPIDDSDDEHTDVRRLKGIEAAVKQIADSQKIAETIARGEERMMSQLREMNHKVDGIDRSLHGERDGKTGLVARIVALEAASAERTAQLAGQAAEKLEDKRTRTAVIAAAVAAAAAVVGAIIAAVAMYARP